VRSAIRKETRV